MGAAALGMSGGEAAPLSAAGPTPLDQLYVYVTDGCNCACRHCWIVPAKKAGGGKAARYLSPALLEAAVEEAVPLGLTTLKWTGGEPTMHPDLAALLDVQRRHGLGGHMETNGLEVTAELAARLAAAGVDFVSVSLDGATPETHDAVRGVRGAHARALAGARHLVAAGLSTQFIMSAMRGNAHELEAVVALAAELGVGSVKVNFIQPTLRGADVYAAGEGLTIEEHLALYARVRDELRPRYALPIYVGVPAAFRPLGEYLGEDGADACGIRGILGLLADGSYALCGIGEHVPELVFGRAGQGELAELWAGHPVLERLREGLPDGLAGVCGRCLMRGACLGSCVAQNYYRSGDVLGAYWFCELAEEQGLFPAGRLAAPAPDALAPAGGGESPA
jgi:SynChlorMet cassette radical SAM/SPASM protein ScmF